MAETGFRTTCLRDLMLQMIMMGKNMVKVYDQVPKHLFPDEYLPDDYDGPSEGPSSKLIGRDHLRMALFTNRCTLIRK